MSVEAFTRVLNGKVGGGNRKVILLAYANHAGPDGRHAFPAYATVAEYAEVDVRTVNRIVKSLERDGWLRRGDQELVAHIRRDRRPIVFDIAMDEYTRERWRLAAIDERPVATPARDDKLSPRPESTAVDNSTARHDDLSPRDDADDMTPDAPRGDTAVSDEPSVTVQIPPSPAGKPAGAHSCPAHPTGRPNCRFCGTTPRQLAEKAKRAEDDRRRTEEQAAWRREREEHARQRQGRDQAAATAIATAKAAIAETRARATASTK